jgi:hypothetical protein
MYSEWITEEYKRCNELQNCGTKKEKAGTVKPEEPVLPVL